jgi:hypothetical protein
MTMGDDEDEDEVDRDADQVPRTGFFPWGASGAL